MTTLIPLRHLYSSTDPTVAVLLSFHHRQTADHTVWARARAGWDACIASLGQPSAQDAIKGTEWPRLPQAWGRFFENRLVYYLGQIAAIGILVGTGDPTPPVFQMRFVSGRCVHCGPAPLGWTRGFRR